MISMMEMGSMNASMMRITICMLAMMIHGDTGSPVANVDRPMAAPEWARIWLKAVALVTTSRVNPETSTVPRNDFCRISHDTRRYTTARQKAPATPMAADSESAAARRRARPAMSRYYEARKSVRPRSYDELDHGRMLMVGGPARCLEQIQEIADTGANYIIFSMNFAGLDQKSILESMAMMAEEVLPKVAALS